MPGKRTTMRKLRDLLRLRHAAGLSIREISRSTKLRVGGIQKLLSRAQALQLSWPLPAALDDTRSAHLFYPGADTGSSRHYQVPDWPTVHQELKRPHVTKRLLWEEYTQRYPNRCYNYSQFCDRYRHWCGQQRRTLRQSHKAGEKRTTVNGYTTCNWPDGGRSLPVSGRPGRCLRSEYVDMLYLYSIFIGKSDFPR